MALETKSFQLPLSVVSRIDIGRVRRELESLDEFIEQAQLRRTGTPMTLPRTARTLDDIAQLNGLSLLEAPARQTLQQFLDKLKTEAPTLHISFASDPSPAFLTKLMTWLRREIHPLLLLQIGLQPSIAAGCIVRTPNHYFDFSLRKHIATSIEVLINQLAARGETGQ